MRPPITATAMGERISAPSPIPRAIGSKARTVVSVLVIVAAILVLGAVSMTRLPLAFLPKMEFPFIGVWAPCPNSVPSQVEKQLARPIEEVLAEIASQVPEKEWQKLPPDLSDNLDHYLYGAPRK